MKRIVFITGTRADYGKLKSLMLSVEAASDYELHVYVTGMHLLSIFILQEKICQPIICLRI